MADAEFVRKALRLGGRLVNVLLSGSPVHVHVLAQCYKRGIKNAPKVVKPLIFHSVVFVEGLL